jgi:hypothetical protein
MGDADIANGLPIPRRMRNYPLEVAKLGTPCFQRVKYIGFFRKHTWEVRDGEPSLRRRSDQEFLLYRTLTVSRILCVLRRTLLPTRVDTGLLPELGLHKMIPQPWTTVSRPGYAFPQDTPFCPKTYLSLLFGSIRVWFQGCFYQKTVVPRLKVSFGALF